MNRSVGTWVAVIASGGALLVILLGYRQWTRRQEAESVAPTGPNLQQVCAIPSAASQACGKCHEPEFNLWLTSQHAGANRLLDPHIDPAAFDPSHTMTQGALTTTVSRVGKLLEVAVTGPDGNRETYQAEGVIGIEPLRQYLVPVGSGRWQALDFAFDPAKKEWFDVFGAEVRLSTDWGYWRNRGMNWNSQCAYCHMTNFQKGYDIATDSYRTTWDEMGIGCRQCHSPMTQHTKFPQMHPVVPHFIRTQYLAACFACHSRREELTGGLQAGESYYDNYRPVVADVKGIFYADGQIRDEDYEANSFLMSRMWHKGVICLDCHNPHSGKTVLPIETNQLCLQCHAAPGDRGAIVIDPKTHSHHALDNKGNQCVECHMAKTTYMARDPRRDHGFICPDPVLTKEFGIPNACNRCHTNQTTEWAIQWTDKWYGNKMERRTRQRARVVVRAQRRDDSVVPELLAMAQGEEIPAWRAVLISLLAPWADRAQVFDFLKQSLEHPDPLVRSAAVRALGNLPRALPILRTLEHDPTRLVRLDVAWAFVSQGQPPVGRYQELVDYLAVGSDQPGGALRQAQFAMTEQRLADAEQWARKAVAWDPNTVPSWLTLGTILDLESKHVEAEMVLKRAQQLDPRNAEVVYELGLLYGELNRMGDTIQALRQTVEIDPKFGRAWYNLGLAYAQTNELAQSLAALQQAEKLLPESPDPAYAAATIYLRLNNLTAARDAARRALVVMPNYQPARALLESHP